MVTCTSLSSFKELKLSPSRSVRNIMKKKSNINLVQILLISLLMDYFNFFFLFNLFIASVPCQVLFQQNHFSILSMYWLPSFHYCNNASCILYFLRIQIFIVFVFSYSVFIVQLLFFDEADRIYARTLHNLAFENPLLALTTGGQFCLGCFGTCSTSSRKLGSLSLKREKHFIKVSMFFTFTFLLQPVFKKVGPTFFIYFLMNWTIHGKLFCEPQIFSQNWTILRKQSL